MLFSDPNLDRIWAALEKNEMVMFLHVSEVNSFVYCFRGVADPFARHL